MSYVPLTAEEYQEMLQVIGVSDIEDLWQDALGEHEPPILNTLPKSKSEYDVKRYLSLLASRNANNLTCFVGGGFYDHFIPAAVDDVSGRSEFYTAYTPYQPEASQGTLQAIYEFQSSICRLTDMEVANASMYDGGTSLFEAMMMALRITRRRKAVVVGSISPIYREMIICYCKNLDIDLEITDASTKTDIEKVSAIIDKETACVVVSLPNAFGVLEDYSELTAAAAELGVMSICSVYPIALALLKTPGEMGFDIVTGEGQSLGLPLAFGGPYLGFMATRFKHVRKMPGRISGRTVDHNGKDGFVLTLQAREQHIRREKATSNICTNQGLCALRALAYLTFIGKEGLANVARTCAAKAVYCRNLLLDIEGIKSPDVPFFNEFVIELPYEAAEVAGHMVERGYAAGFPLGRYFPDRKKELLIAVTEKRTREEIRGMVAALEAVISEMS